MKHFQMTCCAAAAIVLGGVAVVVVAVVIVVACQARQSSLLQEKGPKKTSKNVCSTTCWESNPQPLGRRSKRPIMSRHD